MNAFYFSCGDIIHAYLCPSFFQTLLDDDECGEFYFLDNTRHASVHIDLSFQELFYSDKNKIKQM